MLPETFEPSRTLLARALLLALIVVALPACGTLYYAQAARGQWQMMKQRRPIAEVVTDARTPEALRSRLLEVQAMRDFATRELGLPDNGSYRSYADVRRRYVVWNVVAVPEFSVEPQRWCFPIVGCVAYRGYFSESRARNFAARLRERGFDVVVGGVAAYSTLGKLADPVLNTMMNYGDLDLAAIIFHELSHQLVYLPGDTAFNEAFAVTVEQAALDRWLAHRGRRDQLEQYKQRRARQQEYLAVLSQRRAELARLYESKLAPEAMRERKRAIFAALEADIRALEQRHGVRSGYSAWIEEGLNNAHLASLATYFDCVPGFERMLAEHDGDLGRFYSAVRDMGRLSREERRARLCRGAEAIAPPVVAAP